MERIDQEGRAYMLGVFERSMPEGAYDAVLEWTESVLSDEEWAARTERVSELE